MEISEPFRKLKGKLSSWEFGICCRVKKREFLCLFNLLDGVEVLKKVA